MVVVQAGGVCRVVGGEVVGKAQAGIPICPEVVGRMKEGKEGVGCGGGRKGEESVGGKWGMGEGTVEGRQGDTSGKEPVG